MATARRTTATPPEKPPTESEQREAEEAARSAQNTALHEPSPVLATVTERMNAILAELPAIGKDTRNDQQKFMYRSHDAVLNALNPLLAKHGVTVVPHAILERVIDQRATRSGGVMYEVNLLILYRFYGLTGDYIEAQAWGEGTDSGDKATNKAMTMAFKNILAQSFSVSTAETVDSDSTTDEVTRGRASVRVDPQPTVPPNLASAMDRFDKMFGKGEALPWLEDLVEKRFGVTSMHELDDTQRRQVYIGFASATMLLEEHLPGEPALTPGVRNIIIGSFATKNDGVQLEGPAWALNGEEAEAGRPSKADLEAAAEPVPDPGEGYGA